MNHENDPTDSRVADHLDARAKALIVGDTPVGDVVRRGRQRRNRKRTGAGALTAAVVIAGSVMTISALSQPSDPRQITNGVAEEGKPDDSSASIAESVAESVAQDLGSPEGGTAALDAQQAPGPETPGLVPINVIPSNLVWSAVRPDSTEALAGPAFGDTPSDAPYIEVSSAPGEASGEEWNPGLYRSEDGISWTPLAGVPEVPLTAFDAFDGAMYAFGTIGATTKTTEGGTGDLVVESSSDSGESWVKQMLPLDLRSLAESRGVASVPLSFRNIAAGPQGVIAVVQALIELDREELGLPKDGLITSYSADGVELRKDPCPAAGTSPTTMEAVPGTDPRPQCNPEDAWASETEFRSWRDLGVVQTVVDAVNASPYVFVKASGAAEFSEVTFPLVPEGFTVRNAIASATIDGFAITADLADEETTALTSKLYLSPDGGTWTEYDVPLPSVHAVGQLGDGTYVALGSGDPATGHAPLVSTSIDGLTWSTVDLLGLLTDDDGTSAQLRISSFTIGSSGITLSANVGTDSSLVFGPASFPGDGVPIDSDDSGKPNDEIQAGGSGRPVVLHSDDGRHWSRDDLLSIAGFPAIWANRSQSAAANVLVTVLDPTTPNTDGTPGVVVLVGTPKT